MRDLAAPVALAPARLPDTRSVPLAGQSLRPSPYHRRRHPRCLSDPVWCLFTAECRTGEVSREHSSPAALGRRTSRAGGGRPASSGSLAVGRES